MRVLLSTYGSRGDVEPMVALAVQLQARGAEVRMCAPPDREFSELLAREGVPMVPFDKPWRSWERPPTAAERQQRVSEFIAAQYDTVAEAASGCDVIVATALSQFVGPSVAEKLGIPYHFALFCPDVLDGLDGMNFNELFGDPINNSRAAIGLPPVTDVGTFMFTRRPLLAADAKLGPWRGLPGYDARPTGAWLLADKRPLPADVRAFLDAGDPPVYVGFGSMRTVGEADARAAIEGIRALDLRAVVGRGWAGLSAIDDQDDCHVVEDVNHQELFQRVSTVVHHGGAGTTTRAARAGVPQVLVPQVGDQLYWASRVAELGIGVAHDGPALTAPSLPRRCPASSVKRRRARSSDRARQFGRHRRGGSRRGSAVGIGERMTTPSDPPPALSIVQHEFPWGQCSTASIALTGSLPASSASPRAVRR